MRQGLLSLVRCDFFGDGTGPSWTIWCLIFIDGFWFLVGSVGEDLSISMMLMFQLMMSMVCHLVCGIMRHGGVKRLNAHYYLLDSWEIVIEVRLPGMLECAKPQ